MKLARVLRSAIVLKPSTLLHLHHVLAKRKYRMLFFAQALASAWPEGPKKELSTGVSPHRRQIASAFGVAIDKDVDRRILCVRYRPESDSGGPSWLTFLGHVKAKLLDFQHYHNEHRTHAGRQGHRVVRFFSLFRWF